MNANEVIAELAGDEAHANDHVNMGQSSNDVFPSAVHLAAVAETQNKLVPALERLSGSLGAKSKEFSDLVKAGRTHMMDAVPVTLGQEFGGYEAQIRLGRERVQAALPRAAQIPLGGTATGTGLNTHPEFAERVRAKIAEDTGRARGRPRRPVRGPGQPRRAGRALGRAEGRGRLADQDRQRPGADGLRPPHRPDRAASCPSSRRAPRSCPGKVNPVIPEVVLQVAAQVIGNDMAIAVAGSQGAFELNVRVPVIARNLLESITVLTSASHMLAEKCIDGLEPNEEALDAPRRVDPGDRHRAQPLHRLRPGHGDRAGGGGLRADHPRGGVEKGVDEETLDKALDLKAMAEGSKPG